jgi:hypothetical protein
MKKTVLQLLLVAVTTVITSCEKYLDKQPDELLSLQVTFSNRQYTENFLYGIYNYIPSYNFWTGEPFNGIADDIDITWNRGNYPTYAMNLGNWGPTYFVVNDNWKNFYKAFRQVSIFLANVDKAPIPAANKTLYKAEAKYLRAYFYLWLFRAYGPVPLVKDVISFDDPTFNIPRNTFDECVDYILKDLDEAYKDLPVKHENIWAGKPTKGACLAMKARLLLWAASPLVNGNPDLKDLKNKDGKALFPQAYDANRWKLAADAAKAVIDMGVYNIYTVKDSKGDIDPLASYKGIYTSQYNNDEVIWGRNLDGGSSLDIDRHCMLRSKGGWNGIAVTQKIVDEFEMANGKSIKDAESGYVENGFSAADTKYTTKGTWNMYVGREPRFYVTVNYSGASWWDGQKAEFFYKGKDGKEIGRDDHSRTGYLLRKFIDPVSDPIANRNRAKLFPYIRISDIYLMYAEAMNEVSGPSAEILTYVNKVRERAGVPALKAGLSKEELRNRIIHERAVELAGEQTRYFDLRRWKMGDEMGGSFYGMAVDLGANATDEKFFKRTEFEKRVFEKKHYFWPVPQGEIDKNQELIQNPGW